MVKLPDTRICRIRQTHCGDVIVIASGHFLFREMFGNPFCVKFILPLATSLRSVSEGEPIGYHGVFGVCAAFAFAAALSALANGSLNPVMDFFAGGHGSSVG